MSWVIAGVLLVLLLGFFVTALVIFNILAKGLGKAFGYPVPSHWWKFWK